MAIYFVLYGKGNKLITFGKTSCSVNMVFHDLDITRTKRPNILTLKDETGNMYEDDTAQSIINEKFGIAFDITSYVQQNTWNSFILMSPLDKLALLEKYAFHGVDLSA